MQIDSFYGCENSREPEKPVGTYVPSQVFGRVRADRPHRPYEVAAGMWDVRRTIHQQQQQLLLDLLLGTVGQHTTHVEQAYRPIHGFNAIICIMLRVTYASSIDPLG